MYIYIILVGIFNIYIYIYHSIHNILYKIDKHNITCNHHNNACIDLYFYFIYIFYYLLHKKQLCKMFLYLNI